MDHTVNVENIIIKLCARVYAVIVERLHHVGRNVSRAPTVRSIKLAAIKNASTHAKEHAEYQHFVKLLITTRYVHAPTVYRVILLQGASLYVSIT